MGKNEQGILGPLLKQWRKQRNISQQDLAGGAVQSPPLLY